MAAEEHDDDEATIRITIDAAAAGGDEKADGQPPVVIRRSLTVRPWDHAAVLIRVHTPGADLSRLIVRPAAEFE